MRSYDTELLARNVDTGSFKTWTAIFEHEALIRDDRRDSMKLTAQFEGVNYVVRSAGQALAVWVADADVWLCQRIPWTIFLRRYGLSAFTVRDGADVSVEADAATVAKYRILE